MTSMLTFRRSALALAVLAVCGAAAAQDVAGMISPNDNWLDIGGNFKNGAPKERSLYEQYRGERNNATNFVFGLGWIRRDDATGTWDIVTVRDLALDTRELNYTHERQGSSRFDLGYSELVREYPRTVNTGMSGFGTTTPSINRLATPGSGTDYVLKTNRRAFSAGYNRTINGDWNFEFSARTESKRGDRLWGRGYDCAAYVCGTSTTTAINQAQFVKNAVLLLAEPIDNTTQLIDARLNYHTENLLLSFGYYGSFFHNGYGNVTPNVPNLFNNGLGSPLPGYPAVTSAIYPGGGMSLQNVLQTPMALPPDNMAHQFYIDGNYDISKHTRANFKFAHTDLSQEDNFIANGLGAGPGGTDSLHAKVSTNLFQGAIHARPFQDLSLLANVRYEKRNDKTPQLMYNIEPNAVVPATTPATYVPATWLNGLTSNKKESAKLEASYRLPADWRATLGFDFNKIEREVPESIAEDKIAGITALRAETREHGSRFELRHSLSEMLNGAVSYSRSKRGGSNWTTLSQLDPTVKGTTAANLQLINTYCGGVACYGQDLTAASILGMGATPIFMANMADVERKKWKLLVDFTPTERFSLQLALEDGKDTNTMDYNALVGPKGWRETAFKLYSLDGSWSLSEDWKLTGYASRGLQTQDINHSTGYILALEDTNRSAGLGLKGKLGSAWDVGADYGYVLDRNHYGLGASFTTTGTLPGPLTAVAPSAANAAQAALGLPDVRYRQNSFDLHGQYAINAKDSLRLQWTLQHIRLDEWQWGSNGVPFVYADNTTVGLQPQQNISIFAVAYRHKF